MKCEIYDPQKNFPKFTPCQRKEWLPIYPVYKAKQTSRPGSTWHYLFVCVHCGAEYIYALADGAPLRCKCIKRKPAAETVVKVKCDNCGKKFELSSIVAKYTDRHYCCESCKIEFLANLKPTKEWLAMSPKPRDYNLRKIQQPARYDRGGRVGCDNAMGVCI